jgi:thymidylate synthase (FAD)
MRIIEPYFEILSKIDEEEILKKIELIGRVCYKSENNITTSSAKDFISKIIKNGHESVIEHVSVSVKIICDRGVSHEIVRHRLASYSQESTRYCNYHKDKFGKELTVIKPFFWNDDPKKYYIWLNTMKNIENNYNELIESGAKPEEARSILPNSMKTEIIMTMNLREWRWFLKLRTSKRSHPQMREIANPILNYFKKELPDIFNDL